MSKSLPRPITTEQEWLAAILAELRALRKELRPQPAPSDVIELREPAKPKRKRKKE